jgi:peptide/nickel transport system ATP-binding protein
MFSSMATETNKPLMSVHALKKYFPVQQSFLSRLFSREAGHVRAVDGIDFHLKKGEIFGLVGESGSGKTTTGRLLLRLVEPTSGEILFDGVDLLSLDAKEMRRLRRHMQIIFQDPYASLSPQMKVGHVIAHPLKIHGVGSELERKKIVFELLREVGLSPPENFRNKKPYELSGGQRQRVAIARSLVLKPKFIVADEPTSMLDVSVGAQILNLLLSLRKNHDLTYLYITHDISVAHLICDRVSVMYLGRIVETGPSKLIFENPKHPYTLALFSAVPMPDPKVPFKPMEAKGETPNPISPPQGCRFHPRCPYAEPICSVEEPQFIRVGNEHYVACRKYT